MTQIRRQVGSVARSVLRRHGYALVDGSQPWSQLIFNPLFKLAGKQILPASQVGRGYIDCRTTVEKAGAANKTVPQYVAGLWNEEGVVENFISYLSERIPLARMKRILEIGAGTGRFLEPVFERAKPDRYEIYETNPDWSDYLARRYNVVAHPANGVSLSRTGDRSQDLVHAHQVFVYLPVRTCFDYLSEMCRVCAAGGYVVFDCYLDSAHDLAAIDVWRTHGVNYPVILPKKAIVQLFSQRGFNLVDSIFQMRAYVGHTQYLIFGRQ